MFNLLKTAMRSTSAPAKTDAGTRTRPVLTRGEVAALFADDLSRAGRTALRA